MNFVKRTFEICSTGLHAIFGMVCAAVKVWCIYQILWSTGGADAAKIYSACMLYLSFLSMFVNGINSSMLPPLGVLYGEKDYRSIRMLMNYVMKFIAIVVGVFIAPSLIFPETFLKLCGISGQAASGAAEVRIFALSLIGVA